MMNLFIGTENYRMSGLILQKMIYMHLNTLNLKVMSI